MMAATHLYCEIKWSDEDNCYVGYVFGIVGAVIGARGDTLAEACRNLAGALDLLEET